MQLRNSITISTEQQPFHLVNPSPWPIYVSILVFKSLLGILLFFHGYEYGLYYFFPSTAFLFYVIYRWFCDIVTESTFQGHHTLKVQASLRMGMLLFICSEVMLFFSFFWCFFHVSLSPSIWIGGVWPPLGIMLISYMELPALNTVILLSSGISLTCAHRIFLRKKLYTTFAGLALTIIWGLIFTLLQYSEYNNTSFNISDSVYGSIFFMLTGFHGFHVILGFSLLAVCLLRVFLNHFFVRQHVGLECSIWYWHFVDLVWIFLYFIIYCWGC